MPSRSSATKNSTKGRTFDQGVPIAKINGSVLSLHALKTIQGGGLLGLRDLSPMWGHVVKEQIHYFLNNVVLRHRRGLVCITVLIRERDFTVPRAFFLP